MASSHYWHHMISSNSVFVYRLSFHQISPSPELKCIRITPPPLSQWAQSSWTPQWGHSRLHAAEVVSPPLTSLSREERAGGGLQQERGQGCSELVLLCTTLSIPNNVHCHFSKSSLSLSIVYLHVLQYLFSCYYTFMRSFQCITNVLLDQGWFL